MTVTCLDSNVVLALRFGEPTAQRVADLLSTRDRLMVCGPVVTELSPRDSDAETWLLAQGIEIDWTLDRPVWRRVAELHREYAQRRSRSGGGAPRRILTDHLVGAHAEVGGHALFTLNVADYAMLEGLTVLTIRGD